MSRDEIIRMAREAGIPIEIDWAGRPSTLVVKDGGTYLCGVNDLLRFAALVAAAEREEFFAANVKVSDSVKLQKFETLKKMQQELIDALESMIALWEEDPAYGGDTVKKARWVIAKAQGA